MAIPAHSTGCYHAFIQSLPARRAKTLAFLSALVCSLLLFGLCVMESSHFFDGLPCELHVLICAPSSQYVISRVSDSSWQLACVDS